MTPEPTPSQELENILANVAWTGKYTDSGQEVVSAGVVEEAKQKLLKLIDKEVTRSRIDELRMLPISTDPQSRRDIEKRIKELTIQEKGTDNE